MPIRLVLADDHPIVLDGLAQLFGSQRGFDVVACAADGDEALPVSWSLAASWQLVDGLHAGLWAALRPAAIDSFIDIRGSAK